MAETHNYQNKMLESDTATEGAGTNTVTTASELLVAANPDRVCLYVGNTHATQLAFLGLGTTAVANSGVFIPALSMVKITEFTGLVNIIASGSSTVIAYAEV